MRPKLFMTGVTGYIGGDALYAIVKAHPDWEITCLVRNASKGAKVTSHYPNVRLAYGGVEDTDLIRKEANHADITLHFADSSDDVLSANAIAAGIAAKDRLGFWIHTSGTGILFYPDVDRKVYGEYSEKTWDDIENIHDIQSIPSHSLHRDVDKIVFSASESSEIIKTAIVCPSLVYGTGRGPDKTKSAALPIFTKAVLERKRGFIVGSGKNVWSNVHVQDLSKVYVALAEAAASGGGDVSWNAQGYYFTAAGESSWRSLAVATTQIAYNLGYIDSTEVDSLQQDEASKIFVYGAMMWGTNSRSRSSRTRRELGWMPEMLNIDSDEMLTEVVECEARAIGISRRAKRDFCTI